MSDFCGQQLQTLASAIWEDLGQPCQSIAFISGSLLGSGLLGQLNLKLTTSYWVQSGQCIAGGFGDQEAAIYSLVFQSAHIRRMQLQTLGGGGNILWTQLADGDSRFSRESPTKTAAEYRETRKQLEEQIAVAVANWKLGHTCPTQIVAADLPSYPP